MSDQNVNPYLSGADAAPQQSPYLLALTMAHPALALRLLMLISSEPSPLTAMMAAHGIIATLLISKTRTRTAPGRRWAILSP